MLSQRRCPMRSRCATASRKKSNLKLMNENDEISLHLGELCLFVFRFAIKLYLFISLCFFVALLRIVEDANAAKTDGNRKPIKYHKFIELLRCLSTPISALPEFTYTTRGAWHTIAVAFICRFTVCVFVWMRIVKRKKSILIPWKCLIIIVISKLNTRWS